MQILGWLLGGDHMGVTGDVQLIMMGSGEGRYCEFLQRAEAQNKVLSACSHLEQCTLVANMLPSRAVLVHSATR